MQYPGQQNTEVEEIEIKFDHDSKKFILGIKNINIVPSITGMNLPAGMFYLKQGKKDLAATWNYLIYKQDIVQQLEMQQTEVDSTTLDCIVEMLVKGLQ